MPSISNIALAAIAATGLSSAATIPKVARQGPVLTDLHVSDFSASHYFTQDATHHAGVFMAFTAASNNTLAPQPSTRCQWTGESAGPTLYIQPEFEYCDESVSALEWNFVYDADEPSYTLGLKNGDRVGYYKFGPEDIAKQSNFEDPTDTTQYDELVNNEEFDVQW